MAFGSDLVGDGDGLGEEVGLLEGDGLPVPLEDGVGLPPVLGPLLDPELLLADGCGVGV